MRIAGRKSRLTLCIVIFSAFFISTTVMAASMDDIINQADTALRDGTSLEAVIKQALEAAQDDPDLSPEGIISALTQVLMASSMSSGANGVAVSGQIIQALTSALVDMGLTDTGSLRIISEAIQGIRTAASNAGLNSNSVRGQIESSLVRVADSFTITQAEMSNLVNSTFQTPVAATYTPVSPTGLGEDDDTATDTGKGGPPAPPRRNPISGSGTNPSRT